MSWPVFMYHAFSLDGQEPSDADLHYSISIETFSEHLELCKLNGISVHSLLDYLSNPVSFQNKKICFFTFDDGHKSNFKAAQLLFNEGFSADFFINTSTINHDNYLTSSQLLEMKNMGMSIQSHGHEHVYFNELNNDEILTQFSKANGFINDVLSENMLIFSPPGGRITKNVINIAKDSGILLISNSRPGLFSAKVNPYNVPRIAILNSTDKIKFNSYLFNSNSTILKLRIKYAIAKLLKIIMGNKLYEKFRLLVLE